jgi:hypothetical protein
MKRTKGCLFLIGALLSSILLISCDPGKSLVSSTTGTITGKVLDDNGKPLGNLHENEVLVVALYCLDENSTTECLHEDFWDIKLDVLLDSICEINDSRDNCLIHLGKSAASVETNGSYTITDVPPGEYGLVLIYKSDGLMGTTLERDVDPVQAGNVIKCDIETELIRK